MERCTVTIETTVQYDCNANMHYSAKHHAIRMLLDILEAPESKLDLLSIHTDIDYYNSKED